MMLVMGAMCMMMIRMIRRMIGESVTMMEGDDDDDEVDAYGRRADNGDY